MCVNVTKTNRRERKKEEKRAREGVMILLKEELISLGVFINVICNLPMWDNSDIKIIIFVDVPSYYY